MCQQQNAIFTIALCGAENKLNYNFTRSRLSRFAAGESIICSPQNSLKLILGMRQTAAAGDFCFGCVPARMLCKDNSTNKRRTAVLHRYAKHGAQ